MSELRPAASRPFSLGTSRPSAHAVDRTATTERPEASGDGSSFGQVLRGAAESIAQGQSRIDRAVRRGARVGADPAQLLALQAGVYRYNQELELASKLVEKATSAVKTTLQSQQ